MNFLDQILANQFATGLGMTAILGGVVYQIRSLPHITYRMMLRSLTVELTVMSSDDAYSWIERWLSQQPYAKRTRRVELRSFEEGDSDFQERSATWGLTLGDGDHWFRWRGRYVYVEKEVVNKDPGAGRRPTVLKKLRFRTLGRSQFVLRELVGEARNLTAKTDELAIRRWNGYWVTLRGRQARRLDTITLPPGQLQRLVDDLEWFEHAAPWYAERGIPYRRGYLLSGAPGTGKTTTVMALAAYLGRPLCVLNLGSVHEDDSLFSAVTDAPANAIVLIEDIDCAGAAVGKREKSGAGHQPGSAKHDNDDDDGPGGVTRAGLLNVLDGVLTPSGRIFVLTTNRPEALDPALIRPGRADIHETFELLGAAEQVTMARKFYGARTFLPLAHAVAPAALQGAFMQHVDDPMAARRLLEQRHDSVGAADA